MSIKTLRFPAGKILSIPKRIRDNGRNLTQETSSSDNGKDKTNFELMELSS
jgi:hypothetical protein